MVVHESGQCGDIRKKQRSLSCFNTFQPKSEPNSKTTKYFVAFLLASLLTKYKGLKSVSESSSFLIIICFWGTKKKKGKENPKTFLARKPK